jgi:uncharacterized phage-associated protein
MLLWLSNGLRHSASRIDVWRDKYANRTTRTETPSGLDWPSGNGREDSDGRTAGQHEIGPGAIGQGWREGAGGNVDAGTPVGDRETGSGREVGVMTVSANVAAQYICEKSGWSITQLALQKILYLANMVHLGRGYGPLLDGHFEAWDYGPVHPIVYQKVKAFGSKPIPNVFWLRDPVDGTIKDVLDEACVRLLNKTPGELVQNTHWSKGAWARHYLPDVKNIAIPEASILDDYRARMERPKAA